MINLLIPSYWGPLGSSLRSSRKSVHNSQLLWLLDNQNFEKIYIASQDYEAQDYVKDPRIVYIDTPARNPATARNVLLNQLDILGGIGIFIDNDLTSIATLDSIINRITSNTAWDLLGLTYVGKKKPNKEVPVEVIFKRLSSFASGAFAIKAGLGVRFDENMQDMEDKDFSFNLMLRHRLRYYQVNNTTAWFYYDEGDSTIYRSGAHRNSRYQLALEQIKTKYINEILELGNGNHLKAIDNLSYPKTINFYDH